MYIPTQEERYSKVAWYTLLMCLVLPAGVVAWAYGDFSDLFWCIFAFTLPLAHLLSAMGVAFTASVIFSCLIHAAAFYWLAKRCKWAPKEAYSRGNMGYVHSTYLAFDDCLYALAIHRIPG